jgi:hypothetical protein
MFFSGRAGTPGSVPSDFNLHHLVPLVKRFSHFFPFFRTFFGKMRRKEKARPTAEAEPGIGFEPGSPSEMMTPDGGGLFGQPYFFSYSFLTLSVRNG